MIRGLYTAASGMLALQHRQESLSNNLANINTPGFKQDDGVLRSFPEQLLSRMNDNAPNIPGVPSMPGQPAQIGSLHTGVYMSEALPNFAQGDIEQTDNQYDVALTDNLPIPQNAVRVNNKPVQPRLFYTVARLENLAEAAPEEQVRYTRNGSWSVNNEGYLVTSDGYYVLDNQRRAIQINDVDELAGKSLKINSSGEVFLPDQAAPVRLGIRVANNPLELIREGNNLYRYEGDVPLDNLEAHPEYHGFYAVRQGWLERSNVDPTRTMTDMMTVLRAYEANQRVITTVDATLDKAVNEIGRVNG